jgi:hypothetical protein
MRTDTAFRLCGLRALVGALGPVKAERFIALMLREPFDSASGQRQLWGERSVDELRKAAMEWRRAAPNQGLEPTR